MTVEEALGTIEIILGQESLNDLQTKILRFSWEQKTYPEIAEYTGYDADYVKLVGFQLWKSLSNAVGKKITKNNFRSALRRWSAAQSIHSLGSEPKLSSKANLSRMRRDWGDAIDVSIFYGRIQELSTLEQWIVQDQCRLLAILGIGGTGKTALSIKLAEQIQHQFEVVIWRSLHNAPNPQTFFGNLIECLTEEPIGLPHSLHQSISKILEYFKQYRCLLVLDNTETILTRSESDHGNGRAGQYRDGFEAYGDFFRKVGELKHQSCLIITSREKPKEIALLEGERFPIRSLPLMGLSLEDGQALFQAKGKFNGSQQEWQTLINSYAGNPLALKIVATTVRDLFGSSIGSFLSQGSIVFGDIQDLLDQQFNRLADLEKELMYWLAINREPVSISDLQSDLVILALSGQFIEALESLERRSLIEKSISTFPEIRTPVFTLQPVLMEYVIHQFIQQICQELETQTIWLYKRHTLTKAQTKDYIRDIQIRLILTPVVQYLLRQWGNAEAISAHLMQMLNALRHKPSVEIGYAGGNTLNVLCQLQLDLSGYDFSHLTIWQADLRNINLPQTNFSGSDLSKTVFTESFNHIYSMAVSPDQTRLATADTQGRICLWQLSDGQLLMSWKAHISVVRSITFTSDGQTVVSGGDDQLLKLWNAQTGCCRRTLCNHDGTVWAITVSPDNETIAITDGAIKLWHLPTNQYVLLGDHQTWTTTLRFSPDGQLLATGCNDGTIKLWDCQTQQCLNTLPAHQAQPLIFLSFGSDGQTLISGGMDNQVKWWNVQTGECLRSQAHQDWVWWVDCSPDGQMVASCSADLTIKLWDFHTGKLIKTIQGHKYGVRIVLFGANCTLISSDEGQTIKLWDIPTGQCLKTWRGYGGNIWSIAFSPDGRTLISSGEEQTAKLWDVQTEQCLKILKGHSVWVRSVDFSPDGQTVVTCGVDCVVRVWRVPTGECLQIIQGHTSFVWSVDYSPDGQTIATCSADCTLRLWDIQTGACLNVLNHGSPVANVIYSPDGCTLASYGLDRSIKLWDVITGDCLQSLQTHQECHFSVTLDWGGAISFSPDGQTIASTCGNGSIQLWDVATGQSLRQFRAHASLVVAIAYSPDGQLLVDAGLDQAIRVWDVKTGACLRVLQTDAQWNYSLTFTSLPREDSPINQLVLASSGDDRSIRFWNIETGECLKILRSQRPYEGMNITGIKRLTATQYLTLKTLGAIENNSVLSSHLSQQN